MLVFILWIIVGIVLFACGVNHYILWALFIAIVLRFLNEIPDVEA